MSGMYNTASGLVISTDESCCCVGIPQMLQGGFWSGCAPLDVAMASVVVNDARMYLMFILML